MLKLIMFLKIDIPAKKKEITNTYDGVPFLVMLRAVGHRYISIFLRLLSVINLRDISFFQEKLAALLLLA